MEPTTVAIKLAKSKTGRKAILIAVAVAVMLPIVGVLLIVQVVSGMLFGVTGILDSIFGLGNTSMVSTGTIQVTFSQSEPGESAYASSYIPATQTTASTVTFPILYAAATSNGSCQFPWPLLAGVANEETSFGTSKLPGVTSGANGAGAEGPFQFEPATFGGYASPVPSTIPGAVKPPSVFNAVDAAFAAARKLCADGITTDQKLALWSYNAGYNGITFVTVNGKRVPQYNDAMFAHSSDNPAKYVADVISFASKVGNSSVISGSNAINVTDIATVATNSSVSVERRRTWLWMHVLSDPNSCEAALSSTCFNSIPTILSIDGVSLPTNPALWKGDINPEPATQGDLVLFGHYVTQKVKVKPTGGSCTHLGSCATKTKTVTTLVINPSMYGVVTNPSTNSLAIIHNGDTQVNIYTSPGGISQGVSVDGHTIQVIGSPY